MKPIKRAALQGQELSQSALKSSLRAFGNIIFLGGDPPNPPYERGNTLSRALPQLVPSALVFQISWPDNFLKADDGPVLVKIEL